MTYSIDCADNREEICVFVYITNAILSFIYKPIPTNILECKYHNHLSWNVECWNANPIMKPHTDNKYIAKITIHTLKWIAK